MSTPEYAHDWVTHVWRSFARQRLVGYRECSNCHRTECMNGPVDPSMTHSEPECLAELKARRPEVVEAKQDCLPGLDGYGW